MSKKTLLIFLILALTTVGMAQKINITPWGDYTTVSLSDVNKDFEGLEGILKQTADSLGLDALPKLTKFSHGFAFGATIGYEVIPGLSPGLRVGYLMVSPAEVSLKGRNVDLGIEVDIKATGSLSLIPILLGVTYSYPIAEKFSIGAGLYGGLIIGSGAHKMKSATTGQPTVEFEVPYEGSSFALCIESNADYGITNSVSLGVNLGYRPLATIHEMKTTKDVDMPGDIPDIKKGEVAKDQQGKTLKFDFSGLTAGAHLKIRF